MLKILVIAVIQFVALITTSAVVLGAIIALLGWWQFEWRFLWAWLKVSGVIFLLGWSWFFYVHSDLNELRKHWGASWREIYTLGMAGFLFSAGGYKNWSPAEFRAFLSNARKQLQV